MYKLTMTLLLLISMSGLQAQGSLAGTGWKGTVSVPDPLVCILKFDKDTLHLIYADGPTIPITTAEGVRNVSGKDSASMEDMRYVQHGDTLILTKVRGGSPCDGQPGSYKLKIADGKLKLTQVNDPCDVRPYALSEEMTKIW